MRFEWRNAIIALTLGCVTDAQHQRDIRTVNIGVNQSDL